MKRPILPFAAALSLAVVAAVHGQQPAKESAPVKEAPPAPRGAVRDVEVRASLDRTAVWVADPIVYTVEVRCRPGVDILDEDLARGKIKLEGLELTGSESSREPAPDGSTVHRFRYALASYRVDLPALKIEKWPVRYFMKRTGMRLEDTPPAGEVEVPGAVVAFRSTMPDGQDAYELRDDRRPAARRIRYTLAQPVGLGLVVASIVPAAFAAVAFVTSRRNRPARSARQIRHDEAEGLEAVRAIDVGAVEGRREAYGRINTLVRDHLRAVGGVSAGSLTPAEIGSALTTHPGRIPTEMVDSATALLVECERARYGPADAMPTAAACRDAVSQAELVLAAR